MELFIYKLYGEKNIVIFIKLLFILKVVICYCFIDSYFYVISCLIKYNVFLFRLVLCIKVVEGIYFRKIEYSF